MLFAYRARTRDGALQEGTLEANNQDAAATELQRRQLTPVSITEQRATRDADDLLQKIPGLRPTVSQDDLVVFCRQMYALNKAGISIIRTIRGLSETARSPKLAEVLDDVGDRLEAGTTLATALASHPDVFSDLFVAMVHVGENTGDLDQAFKRLAGIIELERETRRRVKQATRYPKFVLLALTAALLIINFLVIPQFSTTFERLGAELPLLTRVLIFTSDALLNYWPVFIVAVLAAVIGTRAWLRSSAGRLKWDRYKMRLPVIGELLRQITLSRFSRNFASTLAAGVPVTQALTVVGEASDNAWVGQHVIAMRQNIERGDSLLRAARETQLFTPLVIQMIAVGEETGGVDEMLDHVADFYDEEVDYGLSRLAESIEPILLAGVAMLVLILALGVFLPIWDLGSAAIG